MRFRNVVGLIALLVVLTGSALAANGPVELTYMTWTINEVPFERQLIEEFQQQYPHIKINVVTRPVDTFDTQIILASQAGSAPDVFGARPSYTTSLGLLGLLADLNPYVAKDPEYRAQFTDGAWQMGTFQGKQYSVPYRGGAWAVYANPAMFEAAGIPLPESWTWDEFVDVAKKLTDPAKGVYGFAFAASQTDLGTSQSWSAHLFANGGKLIRNNRAAFNDEAGVKTLQQYTDLVNAKVTPANPTSLAYQDIVESYGRERVAMWVNGPWFIATLRRAYPDVPLEILPLPTGDSAGSATSGTLMAMSSQTKHPQEAWTFLRFMTSRENLLRWAEAGQFEPPLAETSGVAFLETPPLSTFIAMAQLPNTDQVGNLPEANTLFTHLNQAIQEALLGRATPQAALDQAARRWDEILRKYD